MRRTLVTTLIALAIAFDGCAAFTNARTIVGPDGREDLLVSCSSVSWCYERARAACHGPYKIVDKTVESSSLFGESSTTTTLLFRCAG